MAYMYQSPLLKGRKLTDVIQNGNSWQAEKLLRQGANPNQLQPEGITPFHYAVGQQDSKNLELTRLFLEYGADPNVRSTEGMTPLHVAATWGNVDCLRLLLLNGGNPELKDQDDFDCLDLASQYDNQDCVELLLDFLTESDSPEEDCCRYTIVPCDDKKCLSFLSEESPKSGRIIKPQRRNTSMYTQDINSLLSSCLQDEESCRKDLIFDVTSPNHPYMETRGSATERTYVKQRYSTDSKNPDVTASSEDSFVTCASQEPELSVPKSRDSYKFSPLASSSPPVSVILDHEDCKSRQRGRSKKSCTAVSQDDSGFDAPHMCENAYMSEHISCHCNNLNSNNVCNMPSLRPSVSASSCHPSKSHPSCQSHSPHRSQQQSSLQRQSSCHHCQDCHSASETCLEQQFNEISLRHKKTDRNKLLTKKRNSEVRSCVSSSGVPTSASVGRPCDSDSDTCSLFSHISIHDRNISSHKPSQRGDNSSLPSEEDSLADFIPDDFNLSDLTINTNNSNKRENRPAFPKSGERLSVESAISSASTIDYMYIDPEEGVTLIERHCPSVSSIHSGHTSLDSVVSPETQGLDESDDATVLYSLDGYCQTTPDSHRNSPRPQQPQRQTYSSGSCQSEDSEATLVKTPGSVRSEVSPVLDGTPDIPPLLKRLSNVELKNRLVGLGDEPGPITPSTRQTYLVRLVDLEKNPDLSRLALTTDKPGYSAELRMALIDKFSYGGLEETEVKMVEPFQKPRADRKWREGVLKSSFNYLLLDPRIAQNLPSRAQVLGEQDTFKIFISAIFYIGKGKRSRPYCHLYEAIKHRKSPQNKDPSEKIQRILDVWADGLGVISLHIFQNVIPVEAYTREACMVDAMGLSTLTNKKRGDYYGPSSTWPANQRRKIGVHLLKKALRIFLAEGERQICPPDIGIGQ